MDEKRLVFLDVLRGVAVILVVYYHYTDRVPFEFLNASGPASIPFYSGKIGVYIFFVLSGILIAKSLEHSRNLADFFAKRVSRIWPLFAFSAVVIFVFLQFFDPPVVPSGPKQFYEDPVGIKDLFGTIFFLYDFGFNWVDGVFWSILVELKFYFILGLIAVLFRGRYITAFCWFSVVCGSLEVLTGVLQLETLDRLLHGILIAQYLPFFALGVLIHARERGLAFWLNLALASTQTMEAVFSNPNLDFQRTAVFFLLFAAIWIFDLSVMKSRMFLFLGKYSYSIYLFHQMIGLTIIAMLAPRVGFDAAMVIAFAIVVLISVLASILVEWRFRKQLSVLLVKAMSLIRIDRLPVAGERPIQKVAVN